MVYRQVRKGMLRIDSRGRVWRVARVRPVGFASKRSKIVRLERETPADRVIEADQRTVVQARIGGRQYTAPTARLVWMHAYGPIPHGLHVAHIDGNAMNNAIENLRLSPQGRIISASCERNPERVVRGSRHVRAKLTEAKVAEILQRCKRDGEPQAKVARELGVTPSLVSQVVLRKVWRHVEVGEVTAEDAEARRGEGCAGE